MAFKGQVLYSRTVAEVEKAAKELLKIVETRKREVDQVILGLDIEWRPIFRRGWCSSLIISARLVDFYHCIIKVVFGSWIFEGMS